MEYQIYLASPFFNPEQRERLERVRKICEEEGFLVWDAYHDGIIVKSGEDLETMKKAFEVDLKKIDDADILLGITDGKDFGTIFEIAIAFERKKYVIGYAETLGDRPFNLMLAESAKAISRNIEELREILQGIKREGLDFKYKYYGKIE